MGGLGGMPYHHVQSLSWLRLPCLEERLGRHLPVLLPWIDLVWTKVFHGKEALLYEYPAEICHD